MSGWHIRNIAFDVDLTPGLKGNNLWQLHSQLSSPTVPQSAGMIASWLENGIIFPPLLLRREDVSRKRTLGVWSEIALLLLLYWGFLSVFFASCTLLIIRLVFFLWENITSAAVNAVCASSWSVSCLICNARLSARVVFLLGRNETHLITSQGRHDTRDFVSVYSIRKARSQPRKLHEARSSSFNRH